MNGSSDFEDIEVLIDRYMEAREEGREPPVEELLALAGPARDELRAQIEAYETLHSLRPPEEEVRPAPERMGDFLVLEPLASGGSGTVYRARDEKLGREVALKLLNGAYLSEAERALVLNEARSMAQLEHPSICQVFEVREADGRDYVAMELLNGPSLAEVIDLLIRRREGEVVIRDAYRVLVARLDSIRERVKVLIAIARALDYCHDHGVIHRDIKPQNILFSLKGEPKLIDFGNAHHDDPQSEEKLLDLTGRLVGTAGYLAPEQVDSERIGRSPRSDQFSLGVVAYEFLGLELPTRGETRTARLNAVSRAEFARLRTAEPAISPELEAVVHHALARDPNDRYPTLAAFARDLENILEDRPISIEVPNLARFFSLWVARNRRAVWTTVGVILLVLFALGASWFSRAREGRLAIREAASEVKIAELDRFSDFRESALRLIELSSAARSLEGGLGNVLFGSPSAEIERASDAWSRQLALGYERAKRQAQIARVAVQAEPWRSLADLDRFVCPDCPYNIELRELGSLGYAPSPEGVEFRAMQLTNYGEGIYEGMMVYKPLIPAMLSLPEYNTLNPGAYLLSLRHPDGRRGYREFVVDSLADPRRHLTYRLAESEALAASQPVAARKLEMPTVSGFVVEADVPGFRISRPVTALEFWQFEAERFPTTELGCQGRPLAERFAFQGRKPYMDQGLAYVTLREARAYASSIGARLPTALELVAARDAGVVEFDERYGFGEWVADHREGLGFALSFVQVRENHSALPREICMSNQDGIPAIQNLPDGVVTSVIFRVVFPPAEDD